MNMELTEEMSMPSPGELLRKARQTRNWSIDDVAKRLKLRASLIQELERDQYDQVTNQTFLRGYLRSYARLVEIEESQVLQAFEQIGHISQQDADMRSYSKRRNNESNNNRLMMVSYGLLVLLLGLLLWWWLQEGELAQLFKAEQEKSAVVETVESVATAEQAEPVLEAEPVVPVEPDVADEPAETAEAVIVETKPEVETKPIAEAIEVTAVVETEPAQEPVSTQPEVAAQPATPAPQTNSAEPAQVKPAAQVGRVQVSFTGDCWVQVKDATGRNLVANVRGASTPVDVAGEPPYKVVIGAPENLQELRYEGELVAPGEIRAGKVLRLTLPN